MKTTTKLIPVSAAICAALVGCEWGGVHSGESWNDAYSWANFTGTYKLVNAVSSSDAASSAGESATKKEGPLQTISFDWSESNTGTTLTGGNIVEGSVTAFFTVSGATFTDDGAGNLVTTYSGGSGSVGYTAGTVSFSFTGAMNPQKVKVSYKVWVSADGTTLAGTATPMSFRWLNLNQKGNLLTIEMVGDDSKSAIFSGKITGASCPTANEEGYVQAGHIRFTFEATRTTNAKQTLTGSISGDWSGSSSARTGTISNRTIDATFHDGKTATPFQAVSGSTTVYAKEISAAAGVTP